MVKAKEKFTYLPDGMLDIHAWLTKIKNNYHLNDVTLLTHTCTYTQTLAQGLTTFYGRPCIEEGLEVAEVLLGLKLDQETAAAGIISSALTQPSEDSVRKALGENVAKLIAGMRKIEIIADLHKQKSGNQVQIDKIRKMLLAMATDIRVVLIKLAERLTFLRGIKSIPPEDRKRYSQEIFDIYAPLANRLGIGQIKWELEDLAFRYQQPEMYKNIAGFLAERRADREARIHQLISELQEKLKAAHIKSDVSGRAKHIYSIYLKMQRKDLDQKKIYDHSAIRVLVPTVEDCYTALSIVNSVWPPIMNEFDDYIANPKPNGYRSIHTAVVGQDGKHFEIQLRTYEMHEESERGVAAHWLYKESNESPVDDRTKMTYLRQLIDWHQEVANATATANPAHASIMEDQVYVITPAGDIIDLPQGATPLDFAYHIHSEIGHRCRGAKVNGHIVPLTYTLRTGDKVDIHTIAEGSPSRDWLNPESGYIKTARARSKISHWFKQKDAQIAHTIQPKPADKAVFTTPVISPKHIEKNIGSAIAGASGLLTRYAKCCKPIPGDPIIGYITQTSGISIHKKNCANVANLTNPKRFIDIDWDHKKSSEFITDLKIMAQDQEKVLHDLTALFVHEKIKLLSLNSNAKKDHGKISIFATIQIQTIDQLQHIKHRIQHLPGIIEVTRVKR